jgi:hypothetical protein
MSEQEYENLWHYSEQFCRDPIQRSELLTMAYVQGKKKMGEECPIGLMKSVMHYRSKELNKRSAFPLDEVGKKKRDAWNHDRVYVDRPLPGDEKNGSLADFLLPMKTTPLDFTIANDFMESLTGDERLFLDDLTAGYKLKEIAARNNFEYPRLKSLRTSIQEKAVAYL